jgi:DNA-binding GntR family transcriptional regulator
MSDHSQPPDGQPDPRRPDPGRPAGGPHPPPTTDRPFATLSLEHSSTVDRVAEELRRALFDGEVGPGTPLRELALAEAMGVSRSTIREALGALVAEGLATRAPNRGVFVTELDPQAVHDVGLARAVLEVAGARRWAGASDEERAAVREAIASFRDAAAAGADPSELTAAHLAIHRSLAALAGSPRLLALADSLYAEIRLGLAKVDRIRRNAEDQVAAHQALLDLLEQGDVETAARDLEEHLAHAETSMLEALHLPYDEEP